MCDVQGLWKNVFLFQIGEIKKLVNLFAKNSEISQIYTRKHTLQIF
jgi:hypothetical protein